MPKKVNRNIRFTECCDTNFIPIAEAGGFEPPLINKNLTNNVHTYLFNFCCQKKH